MRYIIYKRQSNIYLKDVKNKSIAKICLDNGGGLQKLTLNNITIIDDLHPLKYDTTYASAVLFPFANRIKNGVYLFDQKKYKLDCNDTENNNAIHGLVYNKKFNISNEQVSDNRASVTLRYVETERVNGFPFLYSITLKYTLFKNSIGIIVNVRNMDNTSFPFTVGWHPYFLSKSLYKSSLKFNSNQKVIVDKNMITIGVLDRNSEDIIQIKDKKFDDCFILNKSKVCFQTPEYNVEVDSSGKENYLQIYTPNKSNTIAIETTTGPSDSFNNKLGLRILEPNKSYKISWSVKLTKKGS